MGTLVEEGYEGIDRGRGYGARNREGIGYLSLEMP